MYNKQPTLTSIPEQIEKDDEIAKWVPKKKHEVLKAKYKCLKKLFQIYDASVIGILPQNYTIQETDDEKTHRRRSRRTKTDACAGTNEDSNGDISGNEAVAVINDLKLNHINIESSAQIDKSKTTISNTRDDKSTQDSKEDVSISDKSEYQNVHYLTTSCRKKPTRFQIFLQRILGIKQEKNYYAYGDSDNNINRVERKRRNGLQFRRLRRPKKTHSDIALRDVKNPIILTYVQSVQRNYLMDTTPRHCPMVGCNMISYGIINYNDHLNLCHFPDRKYICHYCHEGFTKEFDKIQHENEHIGITKVNAHITSTVSTTRISTTVASNTQTEPISKMDVPEEKLKKIVSFFDKIANPEQILADIKKGSSETTHYTKSETQSDSTKSENSSSKPKGKKISCCSHLEEKVGSKISTESDYKNYLPVKCQLCGENFDHRRQLNLHVDLEHRANDKFSKFHSCAGIINCTRSSKQKSIEKCQRFVSSTDITTPISEDLSYDPSTNIIYYSSTESIDKKPAVKNIAEKVRSGFCYKWEPCKSIIRV